MQPLQPGATAPDFKLRGPRGEEFSLAAATEAGLTLLAFYKVACPTCQLTLPFLDKFRGYAQAAGPFRIWGVSQDGADETLLFAKERRCGFPMALDPSPYAISRTYHVMSVPTLFLVGPDGKIITTHEGWSRGGINSLAAEVAGRIRRPAIVISAENDGAPAMKPG